MYKIPGRSIVCDTLGGWIHEMLWVYVVMKLFRKDLDAVMCHCGPKGPELSYKEE